MRSRCPHCQESVDVVDTDPLTEIHCSSCGGSFSLVTAKTGTYGAGSAKTIGHFELLEELGCGAFGRVWKARDQQLDRLVAVKIPHRAPLDETEGERFLREARATAQLRHPGIVSVHEVNREDDTVYLVCDFIQAATLDDWMDGEGLIISEAVSLAIQTADALDYAHKQGVVHRDLKPSNILIDGERKPHITDFGLAKRVAAEVTLTADGQMLGTPSYMSPQQAGGEGHHVDGRSDIYSLGVVLFQLLTGELPFRGSSRMIIVQILNDEPPSLRSLNANIPRDLETITLKCLEKDPIRRFQTAEELAADLKRWVAGEPIKARPVGKPERLWRWCRRNRVVASLATGVTALLLVMAVGAVLYSFRLGQYAEREHTARTEAETYFRMTLDAIDEMLTEVGEESLAHIPQMEPVRKALLQKALALHRELLRSKPSHPALRLEFGRAQHRMGDIYELLGEHEQAKTAYLEAIRMLERLKSERPDDLQVRHYLGISHTLLGEVFRKTAPQQAKKTFREALKLQQTLHRLKPTRIDYERELSRTWNNLGLLLTETGEFEEAEEALNSAIKHLKQLTSGKDAPPDHLADLARSHINFGVLLRKQPERASDAEEPYGEAIRILKELINYDRENREHRYKLSVAMLDLGNLLVSQHDQAMQQQQVKVARQKCEEADQWFVNANSRLNSLRKNFSGIPIYWLELANSHNSRANALVRLGEFKNVKTHLDLANDGLVQLAEEFPEYAEKVPEYQSLKGVVLGCLGALAFDINKDAETAQTFLEKAIEHQRNATQISPDNPKYNEKLRGHRTYYKRILRALRPVQEAEKEKQDAEPPNDQAQR